MGARDPEGGGPLRRWQLVRAGTDAIPSSVRRFMRRARQRRLRAAAPWGLVVLVVLAVGLLGWVVFASPVLGVRHVEVAGVLILSPDEVRAAAAVPDGTPLTRVDVDGVRRRVEALPPAGRVEVTRQWPGTLLITVVERTEVAALVRLGPDGKALKEFDLMDDHGVIFRTVRTAPHRIVMMRLAAKAPSAEFAAAAKSGLKVLRALTPQLRAELVTLVVDGPARIRLELQKDRIVTWGDAEESELKAKVATALLARPAKQIDVSAPEVVTFK